MRLAREAPGVRLRFLPKLGRESTSLQDGSVDLETGVVGQAIGPEVRALSLFHERLVGAVRLGQPLSKGKMTSARHAAGQHILVSRRGLERGPVDEALEPLGLVRGIVTIVGGFSTALALARRTDLIATVPERHTESLRAGLHHFPIPIPTPVLTISLLWHPRRDADPAHRWLRGCVREICGRP